jgi:hypothetical protein
LQSPVDTKEVLFEWSVVKLASSEDPTVWLEAVYFGKQEEEAPHEVNEEQHRDEHRDHAFDALVNLEVSHHPLHLSVVL